MSVLEAEMQPLFSDASKDLTGTLLSSEIHPVSNKCCCVTPPFFF